MVGNMLRMLTSTPLRRVRPLPLLLDHKVTEVCLDYKTGFGGQYGVQADRVDRSAVGWDHREQVRAERDLQ